MKRLLAIILLGSLVSGCGIFSDGQKSVLQGGTSITASVENPVTPAILYRLEQVAITATSGLLVYRQQCEAGRIDKSCFDAIASIQRYTRQLKPVFVDLRRYVRANDQINAISLFNKARDIVSQLSAEVAIAPTVK